MTVFLIILYALPEWLTGFNFLIAVFSFLVLVGGAFIVLLLRGRTENISITIDRAVAAENLNSTLQKTIDELRRDASNHDSSTNKEFEDLKADNLKLTQYNKELEEELDALTSEHRTLAGLSVAKLLEFWENKIEFEAKMRDLERELRIEKLRKDGTNVG